ncbi:TonB-dependent receptor [Corallococcus sp. H22C18031201]|nr:TonB-dependent receptor [Corallococcus sp. H22C18031201]
MTSIPWRRTSGAVLVAGLLCGSTALAQSSVIIGTVLNTETKQPAADVVVTATSPNLQGEQTVVTDAQGQYRIPQLPPGTYALRFEKESFKPFARSDVQLRLNRTIRVNVELLPEAFTEEVTVIPLAPTIDVGSTSTGVNVGDDFIRRIAVNRPGGKGGAARSFDSLAELAPGAQTDTFGVSVNGATSPENGYLVDGISTGDPSVGINASPMTVEFVQDVNVITGGYMPEFGRSTGGVITAATKSGSNEFHGTVFANLTPGALEGKRELVVSQGSAISGVTKLHNLGDFGATLGGPILKDKLWFFAGLAPSVTRFAHERAFNSFDVTYDDQGKASRVVDGRGFFATTPIPGSQRTYFADSSSVQYMGKLTYLINQDHNVSLSLLGTPSTTGGNGKLLVDPQQGTVILTRMSSSPAYHTALVQDASARTLGAAYAGAFMDKRLLVDANAGWFHQISSQLPSDGSKIGSDEGLAGTARVTYATLNKFPRALTEFESVPDADTYCGTTLAEQRLRCQVTNYNLGGGAIFDSKLDRYQVNTKLTYILNNFGGSHIIKAGADAEFLSYDNRKAYTGGVLLQEAEVATGVLGWTDARRYGYLHAPDDPQVLMVRESHSTSNTVGGFLQDSYTIASMVTINAGLRYDAQWLYGSDGKLAFSMGNQVSPRLGVIVDPMRNGRSKLFASFSRYYEQVPIRMLDRGYPPDPRYVANHYAKDTNHPNGCDPSTVEGQRACVDPNSHNEVATPESSRDPSRLYSGGKAEARPVDPDIKPQSSDELALGGEYEVMTSTRVGLTYTHRKMNAVIEDMSRDEGNTYFLGNPGFGFAKDFPEAKRDYDAATVYLTRSFSDGWLAQASYTWSRLYGNYAGLYRPETNQLDPNTNADFDIIPILQNRTGLLPADRTHAIKLFGAKEVALTQKLVANVGLSYRGSSGTPINYLGAYLRYGQGETFILPRGSGGRTPWINTIDTSLGLTYRLAKEQSVAFTVDLFNLFNFQGVTSVDNTYTTATVYPVANGKKGDLPGSVQKAPDSDPKVFLTDDDVNPNFGKPTQYQPPRQVRLGLRYTF